MQDGAKVCARIDQHRSRSGANASFSQMPSGLQPSNATHAIPANGVAIGRDETGPLALDALRERGYWRDPPVRGRAEGPT